MLSAVDTSTGKIAKWLAANQERKPLLVSVDVYRPAAREQLRVVGGAVGQAVYQNKETNDPLTLVRGAVKHAQEMGFDTLMIDTAGRLHIDDDLMVELEQIKAETKPIEVLFVADAMTGQDAVNVAEQFAERVGLSQGRISQIATGGMADIHNRVPLVVMAHGTDVANAERLATLSSDVELLKKTAAIARQFPPHGTRPAGRLVGRSVTTVVFTDDPAQAGITPVKAVHWTEVRNAIQLVRALPGAPFPV